MLNALFFFAVAFLPAMVGGAVLAARRLWQLREHRARHPVPSGPPIERIAADLRRLRRQWAIHQGQKPGPGRSVRSRALSAAYIDVLVAACRALEVRPPHGCEPGQACQPGRATRGEIRRVETELHRRGLDIGLGEAA